MKHVFRGLIAAGFGFGLCWLLGGCALRWNVMGQTGSVSLSSATNGLPSPAVSGN